MRSRIQKNKVEMHFRSFPDAKLFQIFLKDPDDVTIELNFLGEVVDPEEVGRQGLGLGRDARPPRRQRTQAELSGYSVSLRGWRAAIWSTRCAVPPSWSAAMRSMWLAS